ncbi:MAG TPA: GPP34 family phosphoprotein [Dermatophilaceae bacterium]
MSCAPRRARCSVSSPFTAGRPREPSTRQQHLRTQLTQVLVQQTTPDSRTAALVSLLHSLKSEHRVVDPKEHGLTRKELQRRAEVSTGDWASEAVREAIEAVMAAVIFGDQVRRI